VDGQEIKAILGKNIKFIRNQRQYSQEILAEKAEISITFLSNIERGLKFPKPAVGVQKIRA
jgi:transcriptional regulator with XRE-family HTH domain